MYFYNRELDLLQPFRLRWFKNTTALISYGVAIRYICCSPSDWCGMPESPQHILCTHPRTVTTAKLVEEIKRCSSRWLKTLSPYYINFAWQGGYAIFSVSASKVNSVDKYIMNQNEHHKKKSFEEEYIEFLNAYNIKYDKDYVLKD